MYKATYLIVGIFMLPTLMNGQCDPQPHLDSCKVHIAHDHFNFLKEYTIDNESGSKEKIEYSINLVQGFDYEYYFTGYKEGHQEVIATLFDKHRRELATNKHHKNYVHVIKHTTLKSGIYYITFTFKDDEAFCGAAVLGFVKHPTEN